jgi:hypothetical protein
MKWAVISGKIRNTIAVIDNLNLLGRLKQEEILENIILSTWENDLYLYPEILSLVKKYEIAIIENKEHDSILNLNLKGSYLKQYLTTYSGLKLVPDDSFVLKLRTDKCAYIDGFCLDNIRKLLETNPNKFINLDKAYGLNYKIGFSNKNPTEISHYVPCIFFWDDKYYFGQKEDLLKILNFNFLNLNSYNLTPEQSLWSNYFISYHPELINFFEACNQQEILNKLYYNMDNWNGKNNKIQICHNFIKNEKLIMYAYLSEIILLNKIGFCIQDTEIFRINNWPSYIGNFKVNLNSNLKNMKEYFLDKKLVSLDIKRIQNFFYDKYKIPKANFFVSHPNKYEGIKPVFSYHHNLSL